MAMTLSELGMLLTPEPMSFVEAKDKENPDENYYHRYHGTEIYVDEDGDKSCFLIVDLCDKGEFVLIVSPDLYNLKECANRAAVFEAVLAIGYDTKSVNFEYNEESGELRATVEFPIGENRLTASQIKSCLLLLLGVIDSADPVIRHAMKTGLVDLEYGEKIEEDSDKKELNDLLKKAGGIVGLRKLAAEVERARK